MTINILNLQHHRVELEYTNRGNWTFVALNSVTSYIHTAHSIKFEIDES